MLELKSFLPWEIFHNQQGCCLFSSANKNLDQSFTYLRWILNCQVHNRTIEKWKRMKMKKCDSRVKTRKGSLEQKWKKKSKTHGRSKKKNERQRPNNIRILYEVLYPFQDQKPSIPKCFPRIPKSITVGLDACQIGIFRNYKNESL